MSVDVSAGDYNVAVASPLTSTSFTVTLWAFMPTTPGADWSLVSLDNAGANYLAVGATGPSHNWGVFSENHGGGTGLLLFTAASAAGKWVFLAISGAVTTTTIYWAIDYSVLSSTTIESSGAGATALWIGNDGFGSGFFPGQVTDVKIWSAALTSAQITNEFAKGPPLLYTSQWAYWPLLNATDGAVDWSGNARNGTAAGAPATSTIAPSVPWDRNQNVMSP